MSRLAEWQVGMLKRLMGSSGAPPSPQQALQVARDVLPVLEELQNYVAAAPDRRGRPGTGPHGSRRPGMPGGGLRGRARLHPRDATALHRRARGARITGHARLDTVLVDRESVEALAVHPRFALRPLRPIAVPDYRRLYPWVLERAT